MSNNKKKNKVLGMPYGTAQHKLRKNILFKLVQETNRDICYKCNKKILNVDDFSIEHKISWLNSDNPKKLFWDLDNITFSHLKCNIGYIDLPINKIKEELKQGETKWTLAEKYNVHSKLIERIKLGYRT